MKSSLNLYRREYVRSFIIVHHGEKEFVWILLIVSPRVCQDCVLIICLSIKKTPMYTAMELRQSWLNILDPKLYINRYRKQNLHCFIFLFIIYYNISIFKESQTTLFCWTNNLSKVIYEQKIYQDFQPYHA